MPPEQDGRSGDASGDASSEVQGLLGDLLLGIDHIGICVSSMDAGAGWTRLLGASLKGLEEVGSQRVTVAFLRMPDRGAAVELVCPMPGNAGLDRFLSARGDALHHIAFATTDLAAALERLVAAGIPLIDKVPRRGAGGHMIAFLHPRAVGGTLIELVERRQASPTP